MPYNNDFSYVNITYQINSYITGFKTNSFLSLKHENFRPTKNLNLLNFFSTQAIFIFLADEYLESSLLRNPFCWHNSMNGAFIFKYQ